MKRRGLRFALFLLLAVVAVLLWSTRWLASFGGRLTGARLARAQRSPEFKDGQFHNAEPSRMLSGSFREMARRQFFGKEQRAPLGVIPVVHRTAADYSTFPASGLRATWIGWASVLVEIDGHRVLTDPIWSDRCSPSTLLGPKRFHPPPIALADLPSIDVVIISHDHFDHLDMPTIRALAPRGTQFVVPLGIGAHLDRWDVSPTQIHELDWNESIALAGLTFTSTPARHYSGRNPFHKDETLWTSWVVQGPQHRFFFSGDSGYSPAFRTIGRSYGPFDLTLIKIGASDPTWEDIHMSPENAVLTHLDLRGAVMLPVHWATFNLAFHPWPDPADRTLSAANAHGAHVYIPRPGEFVEPTALPVQTRWWRF